jgi:hypothetical protein
LRKSTVSANQLSSSTKNTNDSTLTTFTEVFQVPTKKFIGHELTVWLPWFIKSKILRKDIAKPPAIIGTEESVNNALKH